MSCYERRWQCVTDHTGHGGFVVGGRKLVPTRKTLQEGCLAHGDRSVLAGMKKPAFGRIEATACNSRGYIIPSHAPVNVLETRDRGSAVHGHRHRSNIGIVAGEGAA
jgi:hypothetical protein